MRGLFVGTVGAAVLMTAAFGLSLDAFRAGPYDRPLEPVAVPVPHEATYSFGSNALMGVCLVPPCPTTWEFDIRLQGLPSVPYSLRLEGAAGTVHLGTFEPLGGVIEVHWSGEGDHEDDRLVVSVAGRDVGSLPVTAPALLILSWGATNATVHVNEIGGVTLSGIASARLDEAPPPGWEFRARFEGPGRSADMGALEVDDGQAVLDGRVERLRLEDHDHVVIVVAPSDGESEGFPILQADLWPRP